MTPRLLFIYCSLVLFAGCDSKQGQPAPAATTSAPNATSAASSEASGMRSPFAPKADGPSLGPAPDQHVVGVEAQSRDYGMTVERVGPCTVEPHFGPGPGLIKMGVDVEIRALSARQVPANPLYAKLTDSDGQTYAATLAGCAPLLTATRLARGERVRGRITFDVPEKAHGLVMTYAPFIVGSGAQELEFVLAR